MNLTITEVAQAARDMVSGFDEVIVHDKGQLVPVRHSDGTITDVPARIESRVLACIEGPKGLAEVTFTATPDSSSGWWYRLSGVTGIDDVGEVNGTGDVVRVAIAARARVGLPPAKGTPHPSKLRAFQPDNYR